MMNSLKKLIAVCGCVFAALAFGSCDDTLTTVGTTIQPEGDLITVYADTFQIQASTVRFDSIYAKTTSGQLGEIYDPIFGYQKADFMCQFYCQDGFKFSHTPYNGLIDSATMTIFYSSWAGDSLTPMQVSVFPLNKSLDRNYYTNIDPGSYCSMTNPLGVKSYTAYDMSISDSIHSLASSDLNYYYPHIGINLPKEFGQKIYDETVNNPSTFESQESFNEFFPGVYVTNTYGVGNMISVDEVRFDIYYNYADKDTAGRDTIYSTYESFLVTKEVIQMNHVINRNIDKLLIDTSFTYIKTPSGVFTKLVVPTTEISKVLDVEDRYINNFSLNLRYLPIDDWDFAYTPPVYLMLMPEDSVKTFFENGEIEDKEVSFLSNNSGTSAGSASGYGYNASTRTYYFGNVSSLLKTHIENSPNEDLRLLVIPVKREMGSSSSYGSSSYYTTGISNLLSPSGVRIRKGGDYSKVVVLSSKFENK